MESIFTHKMVHAALFFILAALFTVFVFFPSVKKINTDFPNYYVSSNMFLDGKDLMKAYDNAEFNKQVLFYGIEDQFVSFVPYPPVNALLMLPLAKLEPLTAKLIWNIFNLIFFLLSIFFVSKISGLNFFLTGILFFSSGYAFVNNFFFGQAYLLVLMLFTASIYFLHKGKDIPAALLFSLSVLLKFYTIFFLLLFLCRKKFRFVAASVLFIIFLNLIVFTITGWELNLFYYSVIMPRISDGWVGTVYASEFQSVISMLHTFFYSEPSLNPYPLTESPQLYFIFKYVFYFGILFASVFTVLNSDNLKDNSKLQISFFCFVCMLLLPVNASYQYVILIPAIAILVSHFISEKKFLFTVVMLILFFIINSPVALYIISITKNTPYFFLGYVKLFILIFFWINILFIIQKSSVKNTSMSSKLRYSFAYVFLVLVMSQMSLALNNNKDDGAINILSNSNYMISMPDVRNDDIIFTECRNERFIMNSNFGLKFDKENVFNPRFKSSNEIEFETISKRNVNYKKLSLNTMTDSLISNRTDSAHINYSGDRTLMCYSKDGQIFLERISDHKTEQVTSGNSFNYYPVFNSDDSGILFSSDRKRGVGFTSLYEIRINK
ncbi:MAG TPA: glycosyltransferase family 87 protein [Ignavibacteria bacterium]|nr:glycosyltransferase family 87 protein [Ignavibacteria bacterium]